MKGDIMVEDRIVLYNFGTEMMQTDQSRINTINRGVSTPSSANKRKRQDWNQQQKLQQQQLHLVTALLSSSNPNPNTAMQVAKPQKKRTRSNQSLPTTTQHIAPINTTSLASTQKHELLVKVPNSIEYSIYESYFPEWTKLDDAYLLSLKCFSTGLTDRDKPYLLLLMQSVEKFTFGVSKDSNFFTSFLILLKRFYNNVGPQLIRNSYLICLTLAIINIKFYISDLGIAHYYLKGWFWWWRKYSCGQRIPFTVDTVKQMESSILEDLDWNLMIQHDET